MSCPSYKDLSPYLDDELDSLKAKEIKEHVKTCEFCREELSRMLQIRDSLRQEADSTKAPKRLKKKILDETR